MRGGCISQGKAAAGLLFCVMVFASAERPVFTNHFLVELHRGGEEEARQVAAEHGFGVRKLPFAEGLYHFYHNGLAKAKRRRSLQHQQQLERDPRVKRALQQEGFNRKKRGYRDINEIDINVNDPLFTKQWYLINTGQADGTPGLDLNVAEAWELGYTGKGVTIGIMDDGIDYLHPDLASNYILTPTQEKGSTFCQMLRPLPLQTAPANLWLCRRREQTPAAGPSRSRSVMTGEQMAAFHPASTPNPLERPIKMGWLKKQRSIVRNWQQRYFVLRAQQLYYYKDEEDVKPQGCMYLPGSTIKEIATNPEEAGKFVFEVIPASCDQSRTGQDSYVLMASSQAEMEEWVKFLRRVSGTPSGAVFGQRLDETVAYEQKFGPHLVPILVEKCAEFILEHGLNEEGIFRLPGQDNLVKQLRDAFDAGERPSFDRDTDVHTVASLLKLYLRDLPEPVVPWSQYDGFLLCGQLMNSDEAKAQQELIKQLSLLPRNNYNLLSYICRFLHEIQLNCGVNKMSVDNLATVIGVNLIRSKVEDPAVIMRGTPQIQRVMTMMIRDHEVLFPKSKDAPLSPTAPQNDPKKPPVARSSVGWDATEDPPISRTDSASDSDATSPTGQQPNDGCLEDKASRDKPGEWKLQSRKRTQTLPNRKCFLTSALQGANSCKAEIFKNEFWSSSSEAKAGDGHRRTMSQGMPQFFDSQRTSTYDNIPTQPGSPGDEASTLSPQACDSKRDALASLNSETGPGKKISGEEELESLQRMVQELQKEIETQKQMYEEQIENLEKENYDVWAKVVRLNEELENEKKKSAALEISLRNVERSREDVEKRNKALEEEVKEFVKSMKEPKIDA